MIRYSLRCKDGHDFDGWFRSSDAFDTLRAAGQVTCTTCGSAEVEKGLMTPSVATREKVDLKTPREPREIAIEKLRNEVEKNSDYVGMSFASEARAMHEGDVPQRAIHGEAKLDEARKLLEDGIPVVPLPFMPRHRTN